MCEGQQKKVLVYLTMGSPAGSKQLAGIFRYASVSANWDIVLSRQTNTAETLRELYDGTFDGVISSIYASREVRKAIKDSGTHIVFIDCDKAAQDTDCGLRVGNVRSDDRQAGREGARHLLSLGGMRTYGYIPAGRLETRTLRQRI